MYHSKVFNELVSQLGVYLDLFAHWRAQYDLGNCGCMVCIMSKKAND
jgi:hypothetical protein